jgi:hypothetical protein
MSNIAQLIDAFSKLTEGELAVLAKVIDVIKTDINAAKNIANLAILWSKYSLKTQKNDLSSFPSLIDPTTKLPVIEPDYQTVDNYPIIFGNANDPLVNTRSTTFAFGAKAFLGYENDAQGTPYLDTNYLGNTAHDLSEIEVVNYRTLMRAITNSASFLEGKYILRSGGETDPSSSHIFGSVFFRGGTEKIYYGTIAADAQREIIVRYDLEAFAAPQATTYTKTQVDNLIAQAIINLNIPATGLPWKGTDGTQFTMKIVNGVLTMFA